MKRIHLLFIVAFLASLNLLNALDTEDLSKFEKWIYDTVGETTYTEYFDKTNATAYYSDQDFFSIPCHVKFEANCKVCNQAQCLAYDQDNSCISCQKEPLIIDAEYCKYCKYNSLTAKPECLEYEMECDPSNYQDPVTKQCIVCDENCLQCISAIECKTCKEGYVFSSEDKCVDSCQEGEVLINGKCSEPSSTPGETPDIPTTTLTAHLEKTDDATVFTLVFNRDPMFKYLEFESFCSVKISGLSSDSFAYAFEQVNTATYKLTLKYRSDIQLDSSQLAVTFESKTSHESISASHDLNPYYTMNQDDTDKIENEIQAIESVKAIHSATFAPLAVSSSFVPFGGFYQRSVLSLEILFLLKFIDIKQPQQFIDFIGNIPTDLVKIYEPNMSENYEDQQKVKNKFQSYDTSPYILNNITNDLMLPLITFGLAILYAIVKFGIKKYLHLEAKKLNYTEEKIRILAELKEKKKIYKLSFKIKFILAMRILWYYADRSILLNLPFTFFIVSFADVVLFSFTGLVFNSTKTAMANFNIFLCLFFLILGMSFMALVFLIQYLYWRNIKHKKFQTSANDNQFVKLSVENKLIGNTHKPSYVLKLGNLKFDLQFLVKRSKCFYEENNTDNAFQVFFSFVDLCRFFFLSLLVSTCYNSPKAALIIFIIIEVAYVAYFLAIKPMSSKFSTISLFGNEIFNMVEIILVTVMASNDFGHDHVDLEEQMEIGYLFIKAYQLHVIYNIVLVLLTLVFAFEDSIKAFITYLKKLKVIQKLFNLQYQHEQLKHKDEDNLALDQKEKGFNVLSPVKVLPLEQDEKNQKFLKKGTTKNLDLSNADKTMDANKTYDKDKTNDQTRSMDKTRQSLSFQGPGVLNLSNASHSGAVETPKNRSIQVINEEPEKELKESHSNEKAKEDSKKKENNFSEDNTKNNTGALAQNVNSNLQSKDQMTSLNPNNSNSQLSGSENALDISKEAKALNTKKKVLKKKPRKIKKQENPPEKFLSNEQSKESLVNTEDNLNHKAKNHTSGESAEDLQNTITSPGGKMKKQISRKIRTNSQLEEEEQKNEIKKQSTLENGKDPVVVEQQKEKPKIKSKKSIQKIKTQSNKSSRNNSKDTDSDHYNENAVGKTKKLAKKKKKVLKSSSKSSNQLSEDDVDKLLREVDEKAKDLQQTLSNKDSSNENIASSNELDIKEATENKQAQEKLILPPPENTQQKPQKVIKKKRIIKKKSKVESNTKLKLTLDDNNTDVKQEQLVQLEKAEEKQSPEQQSSELQSPETKLQNSELNLQQDANTLPKKIVRIKKKKTQKTEKTENQE